MVELSGFAPVGNMFTNSLGSLGKYGWLIGVFLICVIIMVTIGVIAYVIKTRQKWNIQFRVRQEDKEKGGIYLDPKIIKAKRIVLSNGLRITYLQEELLGKRLFPNLNHYTRPGIYDIIITADNRIFLIDGIESINAQRKKLSVGVRYPGIDYSLDELNRDHSKLNQSDRKSDLVAIVKAISMAVLGMALLIALIIGGKYWIDAKEIDSAMAQSELQLFENLKQYQETQIEQTNAMILLIAKLKDVLETNNLRKELNEVS